MKPVSLSVQFGACVQRLRIQRQLTQVVFAEQCGFYQTYLSRVELGSANPTLNAIEVIAQSLGMTVFELFAEVKKTRVDEPRPKLPRTFARKRT